MGVYHPRSAQNSFLQEKISRTMLEALQNQAIDEDLLITFAIYLLLSCYNQVPETGIYFAKRWSSLCTAQLQHEKGIKIDHERISEISNSLKGFVIEILEDQKSYLTNPNLTWLNDWDFSFAKLIKKTVNDNEIWQLFKDVNAIIVRHLGFNTFLITLLNNIIYDVLSQQHFKKYPCQNSYVTMSVFGNFGRLGNQLFQYASLIGITKRYNVKLLLPPWDYAEHFVKDFPSEEHIIGAELINPSYNYDPRLEDCGQPIDIIGYLQSEKYWHHYKKDVIMALTFKEELITRVKAKYIFNQLTIAIHVRRGDYINHPNFAQLPISWFLDALKIFQDNIDTHILIFSDDIPFCKGHFSHLKNVYFSEHNTEIEDLCLMSLCDKFILSNSTFSWWGAYLSGVSGANIIRPDCLYAGQYKIENDDKDFWPESWRIHPI